MYLQVKDSVSVFVVGYDNKPKKCTLSEAISAEISAGKSIKRFKTRQECQDYCDTLNK